MYATFKKYIEESARVARQSQLNAGVANPTKSIADYVLELSDQNLALFEQMYTANKEAQPYQGKKILFNQHQDRITWAMMLLHQALGAEVEASLIGVSALPFAETALKAANVPYHQYAHKLPRTKNYYALGYDCGGGLLDTGLLPKHGFIELTYTDPALYKDIKCPVTSMNNSVTKHYESGCGIGPAILDAIRPEVHKKLVNRFSEDHLKNFENMLAKLRPPLSLIDMTIQSKYWVIVGGAGKVSAGLIRALLNEGVSPDHILPLDIDTSHAFIHRIDKNSGVRFLDASLDDLPDLKEKIRARMPENQQEPFTGSLAFIMATGIPNLMSNKNIRPEDFPGADFINAQHFDGYGPLFSISTLMGNARCAANFIPYWLEFKGYPTEPRYVIPTLILMALQGLNAIKTTSAPHGLKDVPINLDREIYEAAKKIYNEKNEFDILDSIAEERFAAAFQPASPSYSSTSTVSNNHASPPASPQKNKHKNIPSVSTSVGNTLLFSGSLRSMTTRSSLNSTLKNSNTIQKNHSHSTQNKIKNRLKNSINP